MKHEEAIKKVLRTFRDDEDDALLRLALLKERADYRNFFTVALRKAVETAYSKIVEGNARGPGYVPDEETSNTLANFRGVLRHRFGIRGLTIPLSLTTAEWLDVLDPIVDVWEIPANVRRAVLPRLFYTPGVWEVVPPSGLPSGRGEAPAKITSPYCAPYERLLRIDLRKKPARLLKEFGAILKAVDAHRGMNPEAYEAWRQDRTRKREEAWDYLKVWQMRRKIPMPSFPEIAKELPITPEVAKWRFYRAYEMIYGERFNRDAWEKDRAKEWEKHREIVPKTCKECPQWDSCTDADACPALFDEKKSGSVYLVPMGAGQYQEEVSDEFLSEADKHSYQEWLNREENDKE
jgi:hypothetical protein